MMTPREILTTLSQRVAPAMLRDKEFTGVVEVEVRGDEGGVFNLAYEQGGLQVREGRHATPYASMSLDSDVFVDLCYGARSVFEVVEEGLVDIGGPIEPLENVYWLLLIPPERLVADLAAAKKRAEGRARTTTIERVSGTDHDLAAYAARDTPVILQGAITGWPPLSWDLDELVKRFGDVRLVTKKLETNVAGFVARIRASAPEDDVTTGAFTMPRRIFDQFGFPPIVRTSAIEDAPEMFLSARGAVTPIHRDMTDGILVNIFGRRRFRMFSPDQEEKVYPFETFSGFQECRVDPDRPDAARYPRFADAKALEFVVEPGEVVLVPFGWFHHVNVVEHSLAVRYNLVRGWTERYVPLGSSSSSSSSSAVR